MIRLCRVVSILALLLACLPTTFAQTTHRPISDFLDAQAGLPAWYDAETNYGLFLDYPGIVNRILIAKGYPDLGTTFLGDVSESVMSDGRTHVSVVLHTHNAWTIGVKGTNFQIVLGYGRAEILSGASPALGDCTLTVDFVHAVAPGGPLPDLYQLFFYPTPDQQTLRVSLMGNAFGALRAAFGVPEGTPGMVQTTQVILTSPGKGKPLVLNFGSPSDWVKIRAVGK